MLHHATLEIAAGELEASLDFWRALGFERVEPPESLAGAATWVESDGTQIHLVEAARPVVPEVGHVAVIVPDFDRALDRLEALGIDVEARAQHWGEPRAFATAPGGHRVELMAAPPNS